MTWPNDISKNLSQYSFTFPIFSIFSILPWDYDEEHLGPCSRNTPPPPDWSGNAQTSKVRNEFSIIFQYKVVSHMYLCNALFLWHFNTHEILLRLWYIEPNQKFLRFGLNFRNVFLSATFIYESNLILLVWRNNLFYC